MNSYETDKQRVSEAADRFPATFGLRAFPGDTFTILRQASYVSEGQVMLYTGILKDGRYLAFAKGTPEELQANVVPLQVQTRG